MKRKDVKEGVLYAYNTTVREDVGRGTITFTLEQIDMLLK